MAQVPPTYVHHPFCYGHYSPLQTPSHKPNATGDLHCAVPTAGQEDLGALAKPPARKGRSADGRSTCTSETVPSRWRSCLFTGFFPSIKFLCIQSLDASTSFLFPRLFQLHPPQARAQQATQVGGKGATGPLLGRMSPATTTQPVTQALHLPKQRVGHTHALLPTPLTQGPRGITHFDSWKN